MRGQFLPNTKGTNVDLEKMKAVASVLERMVLNEERMTACETLGKDLLCKYPCTINTDSDSFGATAAEVMTILEARKKTLVAELRDLGMAHLATPTPPPSKSPALDAAVASVKPPGASLDEARRIADDPTDPCAAARVSPT